MTININEHFDNDNRYVIYVSELEDFYTMQGDYTDEWNAKTSRLHAKRIAAVLTMIYPSESFIWAYDREQNMFFMCDKRDLGENDTCVVIPIEKFIPRIDAPNHNDEVKIVDLQIYMHGQTKFAKIAVKPNTDHVCLDIVNSQIGFDENMPVSYSILSSSQPPMDINSILHSFNPSLQIQENRLLLNGVQVSPISFEEVPRGTLLTLENVSLLEEAETGLRARGWVNIQCPAQENPLVARVHFVVGADRIKISIQREDALGVEYITNTIHKNKIVVGSPTADPRRRQDCIDRVINTRRFIAVEHPRTMTVPHGLLTEQSIMERLITTNHRISFTDNQLFFNGQFVDPVVLRQAPRSMTVPRQVLMEVSEWNGRDNITRGHIRVHTYAQRELNWVKAQIRPDGTIYTFASITSMGSEYFGLNTIEGDNLHPARWESDDREIRRVIYGEMTRSDAEDTYQRLIDTWITTSVSDSQFGVDVAAMPSIIIGGERDIPDPETANMQGKVLSYHSPYGRADKSQGEGYRVGFEIEKEDAEVRAKQDPIKVIKETGWAIERDGSLDNYTGFEVVSPILPLMNDKVLKKSFKPIEWLVDAKQSVRCGGHIHVSIKNEEPEITFGKVKGYLPLLYAMYPARSKKRFSKAKKLQDYSYREHHQAINITDNTLEFRIFPSPRNMNILWFRIKLLRIMLQTHRPEPTQVIDDIRSDTPLSQLLGTVYNPEKLDLVLSLTMKYALKFESLTKENMIAYHERKKSENPEDKIVDMILGAVMQKPTKNEEKQSRDI